jgi:hypothetical protein
MVPNPIMLAEVFAVGSWFSAGNETDASPAVSGVVWGSNLTAEQMHAWL